MKHDNSGSCPKCMSLIEFFPGLHPSLLHWFQKFQSSHPEAHISCAGRGEADQNQCYEQGTSRAHWMESAHNWNCALDFFVIKPGIEIYDKAWFENVLAPAIPDYLEWYGMPHAEFYELPHVQLKAWRSLRNLGLIKTVEPVLLYNAKIEQK